MAAAVLGLTTVLALASCSSGRQEAGPGGGGDVAEVDGKIALTYLQKQGDQEYFVGEAAGAKARADELGIDLKVVNLGTDANKTISEAQSAISQKSNGLIVVVPDPAVGPQVAQIAKDAKVALLTSDDQICTTGPDPSTCSPDALVPRVGFSGAQMGGEVGKRAAAEFKKAGWNAAETRTISAWTRTSRRGDRAGERRLHGRRRHRRGPRCLPRLQELELGQAVRNEGRAVHRRRGRRRPGRDEEGPAGGAQALPAPLAALGGQNLSLIGPLVVVPAHPGSEPRGPLQRGVRSPRPPGGSHGAPVTSCC
ncbi:hypothetical protein ACF1BN_09185 [Streptomyces sp. NPDC014861]|uniref:hypothetical protein n=1 Tax=Streptomyces sp. NPDC014861 TaxID=3364923 RepID=UPI0036F5E574